jgi:hypothetical protein
MGLASADYSLRRCAYTVLALAMDLLDELAPWGKEDDYYDDDEEEEEEETGGKGKGKGKGKGGGSDWTCPKCRNVNYSFRDECNRCKTKAPANRGKGGKGKGKGGKGKGKGGKGDDGMGAGARTEGSIFAERPQVELLLRALREAIAWPSHKAAVAAAQKQAKEKAHATAQAKASAKAVRAGLADSSSAHAAKGGGALANQFAMAAFGGGDAAAAAEEDPAVRVRVQLRKADYQYGSVPPLLCAFVARALPVLLRPGHWLYAGLNSFLLQRPTLDLGDVPMLYGLLNSGAAQHWKERQ